LTERSAQFSPYCGPPVGPDEIWRAWNFDPVLLFALAVVAIRYTTVGAWLIRRQRCSFYFGWALLSFALVSPICNLGVSLFSAREGQHMLMTLVAAPLLVCGKVEVVAPRFVVRRIFDRVDPVVASFTYAALLWLWHVPALYESTFRSSITYWAMHGSLMVASLFLWRGILSAREGTFQAPAAALLSLGQMSALGAALVLSGRPFYAAHVHSAQIWGMSALEDQQLAGILMWVPACTVFIAATLWTFSRSLAFFAPRRLAA